MSFGAWLDTRRRALGLSIGETAAWFDTTERTVNRWIADEMPPKAPDALAGRLDRLETIMEEIADGLVAAAMGATLAGPVRLDRYRTQADLDAVMAEILTADSAGFRLPLGAHAILTAWADDQLAAHGIETVIEWTP